MRKRKDSNSDAVNRLCSLCGNQSARRSPRIEPRDRRTSVLEGDIVKSNFLFAAFALIACASAHAQEKSLSTAEYLGNPGLQESHFIGCTALFSHELQSLRGAKRDEFTGRALEALYVATFAALNA